MHIEQVSIPLLRALINRPRLADAVFRFDKWGNILGPDRFEDPYPIYERMHRSGPVSFSPIYQQWAVTGYEEALEVLSSKSFGVAAQLEVLLTVRPYSKLNNHTKELFRNILLLSDPPKHTRLRSLVNRAFTARQISRLEPGIEQITQALLAEVADDPCPDVIAGFADPLPIRVISDLLGVPSSDWELIKRLSTEIRDVFNPFAVLDPKAIDFSFAELSRYYSGLADRRMADPQDDLLTALVKAEVDGHRLSRTELLSVVALLMLAGHETTTGVLGNSIVALARFPDQRTLIQQDPSLWPNAVEELLRFDTALQTDPRAAKETVHIDSQTIKEGQNLTVMLGAANRDPRRFDDPDTLRLDRPDPSPLSFGKGIHHCIGAALARMELRIGLQAFIDAFGAYTINPDAIVWKQSLSLRGPAHLFVQRPAHRL